MLASISLVSCEEMEKQISLDKDICDCKKGFIVYDYFDPEEGSLTAADSLDTEEPVAKLWLKLQSYMRDLMLSGYLKTPGDNLFLSSLES